MFINIHKIKTENIKKLQAKLKNLLSIQIAQIEWELIYSPPNSAFSRSITLENFQGASPILHLLQQESPQKGGSGKRIGANYAKKEINQIYEDDCALSKHYVAKYYVSKIS